MLLSSLPPHLLRLPPDALLRHCWLQKAKMKDMGEQLDDMSSELGQLRVENNSLKNRNTILEKVLALRDEHIRMLQDEQQVIMRCRLKAPSAW